MQLPFSNTGKQFEFSVTNHWIVDITSQYLSMVFYGSTVTRTDIIDKDPYPEKQNIQIFLFKPNVKHTLTF